MGAGGGPRSQWRPEAWEKPWVGLPLAREELPVPRSRSPRPAASHRAPTVRDRGRPATGPRPGGSADLRWRRGTRRASCELHTRLCCCSGQEEEENSSEPQRRRHSRRSRAARSNGAVTRERGASRERRVPPRGITGNKGVRGREAWREGGGAPWRHVGRRGEVGPWRGSVAAVSSYHFPPPSASLSAGRLGVRPHAGPLAGRGLLRGCPTCLMAAIMVVSGVSLYHPAPLEAAQHGGDLGISSPSVPSQGH